LAQVGREALKLLARDRVLCEECRFLSDELLLEYTSDSFWRDGLGVICCKSASPSPCSSWSLTFT
jgi:hypothetical protein